MRKRFTILIFLCLPFLHVLSSEEAKLGVLDRISSCIQRGNSECLSPYLGAQVELTINNERRFYAPGQAKFVLQQFFDSHPAGSFTIRHAGVRGGSHYALAEYRSSRGIFEVNIFLKQTSDGSYTIEKIRFARK